jgi:hypothetical protein
MTWENSAESPETGSVIMPVCEFNDMLLDKKVNISWGHRSLQSEFLYLAL